MRNILFFIIFGEHSPSFSFPVLHRLLQQPLLMAALLMRKKG